MKNLKAVFIKVEDLAEQTENPAYLQPESPVDTLEHPGLTAD